MAPRKESESVYLAITGVYSLQSCPYLCGWHLMAFSSWTPVCSAWVGGVVPSLLCSLHTLVSRACFKDEANARDHSCPSVLPHCSLPALLPALFISFLVPHAAGPVVWLELGEDNLQIHTSLIFNASQVQLRQSSNLLPALGLSSFLLWLLCFSLLPLICQETKLFPRNAFCTLRVALYTCSCKLLLAVSLCRS